jgi:ABC-type dipeptide/oligopeptide/nickel transport system ATPase component
MSLYVSLRKYGAINMTTHLFYIKGALDKVKIIYDGEIFEQVAVSHLNYAPENN